MAFYAYLLRCSNGAYYAGHTDDLTARFGAHQTGALGGYTSRYRPVTLEWSQDFPDRPTALDAERQIKGWSRAKKEALIRGDWDAIHLLAMRTPVIRDSSSSRSARSADPQDERETTESARPEEGLSRAAVEGPSRRAFKPEQITSPVIILVRPQLGQNIGKAARAMLNFGLTELRLVAPRDGWPNPDAGPAASGADQLLEQAVVYPTVAAAVADCTAVFASTVRRRDLVLPVVGPTAMAAEIHASPGRTAILFGPERSGLATEDVALAHKIVTVPINPEFGSLNLAQAVILLAYEWSRGQPLEQPTYKDAELRAPQFEVEGLVGQVDEALVASNYYFPVDRTEVTRLNLRTMLTKPAWSTREIRALRGMIRSIAKGTKR